MSDRATLADNDTEMEASTPPAITIDPPQPDVPERPTSPIPTTPPPSFESVVEGNRRSRSPDPSKSESIELNIPQLNVVVFLSDPPGRIQVRPEY